MTLRPGDPAPDFTAVTTDGPLRFHQWKGTSWAVLFSHRGDFMPVCTSEVGEMARLAPEFHARDAKVIGLSLDSIERHERWRAEIEASHGVSVSFPLIADSVGAVAERYGLLDGHSDVEITLRAVLVIAPDHTVRLTTTYPASTGRCFGEILRALDSLQLSARDGLVTPASWQRGDPALVAHPVVARSPGY